MPSRAAEMVVLPARHVSRLRLGGVTHGDEGSPRSGQHSGSAEAAVSALQANGAALATEDTMTQAVHDVYCGIMADHEHPNEKDRDQARQLLAALGKATAA